MNTFLAELLSRQEICMDSNGQGDFKLATLNDLRDFYLGIYTCGRTKNGAEVISNCDFTLRKLLSTMSVTESIILLKRCWHLPNQKNISELNNC